MKFRIFFILLAFSAAFFSCRKGKTNDNNNPAPVVCNTAPTTIVCNDTVMTIVQDTAYVTLNHTFYSEHSINATKGCSTEFNGTQVPIAKTYTVTKDYAQLKNNDNYVFLSYYLDGIPGTAQSGTVTISGSGLGATIEFCKVTFKDAYNHTYVVSMKTDFQ